ncbi:MAG: phosphopantetheine-binding protein [Candidatus Margulisbacteria bacterium]|jgi:acyl carrier protein|nr:phosphopantetheine-binding protein [Candidatus Margulisiibacteriota bacterium]
MNKDEIFQHICAVLEKDFELPKEKLTLEANVFADLDLDSIDAMDLVVRLQKLTNIKLTAADFQQIRTLGDVVDTVAVLTARQ